MNKNVIIGIIATIVIVAVGFGCFLILTKNDKTDEIKKKQSNNSTVNENTTISSGKTLVVYYSASGTTKNVAYKIAENLNADIFEIEPESVYTSDDLDWTNDNSRVSKEHDDESLRDVKLKNTKVNDWEVYDTILIGYPIWWGIAACPVNTFVQSNNFDGKTVIPFCTSASSDLGQSGKLLESVANGGTWLEGERFSSITTDADIKSFTDNIK